MWISVQNEMLHYEFKQRAVHVRFFHYVVSIRFRRKTNLAIRSYAISVSMVYFGEFCHEKCAQVSSLLCATMISQKHDDTV